LIWWEDFKVGDRSEIGHHTFTNQAGELVLTMEGWGFFGRKN